MGLAILNVAFFVFHFLLVCFKVFGWAWQRWRPWNLGSLTLTALSWFVMGIWHGIGYCVCTDLHFRVRAAMGIHDSDGSYLSLLIRTITGWVPPENPLNAVALIVFLASFGISLYLNIRDRRSRKEVLV